MFHGEDEFLMGLNEHLPHPSTYLSLWFVVKLEYAANDLQSAVALLVTS